MYRMIFFLNKRGPYASHCNNSVLSKRNRCTNAVGYTTDSLGRFRGETFSFVNADMSFLQYDTVEVPKQLRVIRHQSRPSNPHLVLRKARLFCIVSLKELEASRTLT